MKFDDIINSIRSSLLKSGLKKSFDQAYYINPKEENRAYNLGLYFRKLEYDNPLVFIEVKDKIQDLQKYYTKRLIKEYFTLENSPEDLTTTNEWPFISIILGVIIIIFGVMEQIEGRYTINISAKTGLPVVITGSLFVLTGLIIYTAAILTIKDNKKTDAFYKSHQPYHISE